jgi:nuclear pore complex protein Nup155
LLEAGIPADTIVRILDEMYWRDEVPFQGSARRRLVRDATYAAERWFTLAVRKGGEAILKKDFVKGVLEGLARATGDSNDKARIMGVLDEIRRRLG